MADWSIELGPGRPLRSDPENNESLENGVTFIIDEYHEGSDTYASGRETAVSRSQPIDQECAPLRGSFVAPQNFLTASFSGTSEFKTPSYLLSEFQGRMDEILRSNGSGLELSGSGRKRRGKRRRKRAAKTAGDRILPSPDSSPEKDVQGILNNLSFLEEREGQKSEPKVEKLQMPLENIDVHGFDGGVEKPEASPPQAAAVAAGGSSRIEDGAQPTGPTELATQRESKKRRRKRRRVKKSSKTNVESPEQGSPESGSSPHSIQTSKPGASGPQTGTPSQSAVRGDVYDVDDVREDFPPCVRQEERMIADAANRRRSADAIRNTTQAPREPDPADAQPPTGELGNQIGPNLPRQSLSQQPEPNPVVEKETLKLTLDRNGEAVDSDSRLDASDVNIDGSTSKVKRRKRRKRRKKRRRKKESGAAVRENKSDPDALELNTALDGEVACEERMEVDRALVGNEAQKEGEVEFVKPIPQFLGAEVRIQGSSLNLNEIDDLRELQSSRETNGRDEAQERESNRDDAGLTNAVSRETITKPGKCIAGPTPRGVSHTDALEPRKDGQPTPNEGEKKISNSDTKHEVQQNPTLKKRKRKKRRRSERKKDVDERLQEVIIGANEGNEGMLTSDGEEREGDAIPARNLEGNVLGKKRKREEIGIEDLDSKETHRRAESEEPEKIIPLTEGEKKRQNYFHDSDAVKPIPKVDELHGSNPVEEPGKEGSREEPRGDLLKSPEGINIEARNKVSSAPDAHAEHEGGVVGAPHYTVTENHLVVANNGASYEDGGMRGVHPGVDTANEKRDLNDVPKRKKRRRKRRKAKKNADRGSASKDSGQRDGNLATASKEIAQDTGAAANGGTNTTTQRSGVVELIDEPKIGTTGCESRTCSTEYNQESGQGSKSDSNAIEDSQGGLSRKKQRKRKRSRRRSKCGENGRVDTKADKQKLGSDEKNAPDNVVVQCQASGVEEGAVLAALGEASKADLVEDELGSSVLTLKEGEISAMIESAPDFSVPPAGASTFACEVPSRRSPDDNTSIGHCGEVTHRKTVEDEGLKGAESGSGSSSQVDRRRSRTSREKRERSKRRKENDKSDSNNNEPATSVEGNWLPNHEDSGKLGTPEHVSSPKDGTAQRVLQAMELVQIPPAYKSGTSLVTSDIVELVESPVALIDILDSRQGASGPEDNKLVAAMKLEALSSGETKDNSGPDSNRVSNARGSSSSQPELGISAVCLQADSRNDDSKGSKHEPQLDVAGEVEILDAIPDRLDDGKKTRSSPEKEPNCLKQNAAQMDAEEKQPLALEQIQRAPESVPGLPTETTQGKNIVCSNETSGQKQEYGVEGVVGSPVMDTAAICASKESLKRKKRRGKKRRGKKRRSKSERGRRGESGSEEAKLEEASGAKPRTGAVAESHPMVNGKQNEPAIEMKENESPKTVEPPLLSGPGLGVEMSNDHIPDVKEVEQGPRQDIDSKETPKRKRRRRRRKSKKSGVKTRDYPDDGGTVPDENPTAMDSTGTEPRELDKEISANVEKGRLGSLVSDPVVNSAGTDTKSESPGALVALESDEKTLDSGSSKGKRSKSRRRRKRRRRTEAESPIVQRRDSELKDAKSEPREDPVKPTAFEPDRISGADWREEGNRARRPEAGMTLDLTLETCQQRSKPSKEHKARIQAENDKGSGGLAEQNTAGQTVLLREPTYQHLESAADVTTPTKGRKKGRKKRRRRTKSLAGSREPDQAPDVGLLAKDRAQLREGSDQQGSTIPPAGDFGDDPAVADHQEVTGRPLSVMMMPRQYLGAFTADDEAEDLGVGIKSGAEIDSIQREAQDREKLDVTDTAETGRKISNSGSSDGKQSKGKKRRRKRRRRRRSKTQSPTVGNKKETDLQPNHTGTASLKDEKSAPKTNLIAGADALITTREIPDPEPEKELMAAAPERHAASGALGTTKEEPCEARTSSNRQLGVKLATQEPSVDRGIAPASEVHLERALAKTTEDGNEPRMSEEEREATPQTQIEKERLAGAEEELVPGAPLVDMEPDALGIADEQQPDSPEQRLEAIDEDGMHAGSKNCESNETIRRKRLKMGGESEGSQKNEVDAEESRVDRGEIAASETRTTPLVRALEELSHAARDLDEAPKWEASQTGTEKPRGTPEDSPADPPGEPRATASQAVPQRPHFQPDAAENSLAPPAESPSPAPQPVASSSTTHPEFGSRTVENFIELLALESFFRALGLESSPETQKKDPAAEPSRKVSPVNPVKPEPVPGPQGCESLVEPTAKAPVVPSSGAELPVESKCQKPSSSRANTSALAEPQVDSRHRKPEAEPGAKFEAKPIVTWPAKSVPHAVPASKSSLGVTAQRPGEATLRIPEVSRTAELKDEDISYTKPFSAANTGFDPLRLWNSGPPRSNQTKSQRETDDEISDSVIELLEEFLKKEVIFPSRRKANELPAHSRRSEPPPLGRTPAQRIGSREGSPILRPKRATMGKQSGARDIDAQATPEFRVVDKSSHEERRTTVAEVLPRADSGVVADLKEGGLRGEHGRAAQRRDSEIKLHGTSRKTPSVIRKKPVEPSQERKPVPDDALERPAKDVREIEVETQVKVSKATDRFAAPSRVLEKQKVVVKGELETSPLAGIGKDNHDGEAPDRNEEGKREQPAAPQASGSPDRRAHVDGEKGCRLLATKPDGLDFRLLKAPEVRKPSKPVSRLHLEGTFPETARGTTLTSSTAPLTEKTTTLGSSLSLDDADECFDALTEFLGEFQRRVKREDEERGKKKGLKYPIPKRVVATVVFFAVAVQIFRLLQVF